MSTIDYYDNNAKEYFDLTVSADMTKYYNMFLKYIKKKGKILDFGCGSGRDSLYFKNRGYEVYPLDGSIELCKLASSYTGLDVKCMNFFDFNEVNIYDGVWACSSLVHVNKRNLINILKKLRDSIKEEGVIYLSLKNGEGQELTDDGRYYNFMTHEKLLSIADETNLEEIEFLSSKSITNPNEKKCWNNHILIKK